MDKKKDKSEQDHGIKDKLQTKKRPPKKTGHESSDKRPHFKSFKSPGVK